MDADFRVEGALAFLRGQTITMRGKPSSIALLASWVLVTSAASARPVHTPAHSRKEVAAESQHVALSRAKGHRETVHVDAPAARRHEHTIKVSALHEQPKRAVAVEARVADVASPDMEQAPTAIEPEIHVRHDRKVHLSQEALAAQPSMAAAPGPSATGQRRVATVDDFMAPLPPADSAPALPPATGGSKAGADHPVKMTVTSSPELESKVHKGKTVKIKVAEEKLASAPPLPEIPVVQPVLFNRRGHLIVPPALKGSHEILVHQNTMADQEGLDRVKDDADLEEMRGEKLLVSLPAGPGLAVDERLPLNRRYCRPWTALFLQAMARAHYARFHAPLQVNSAVRTVEFQERLRYTNGNAAPAEGATASPHLTGQAIDVAKHGLSMTEIAWLRAYLLPLVQEGKVDVEEEFQQSCFHISVYKRYLPEAAPRRVIQGRHSGATGLAAAVR